MSDNSMAFLAGGAFAGIAVLLLLKGGVNPSQANLQPIAQQSPLAVQPAATVPPGMAPSAQYGSSYPEQQRLMDDRLKYQLEQQRAETEQLKTQVRNQQMVIDSLTSQAQANTLNPQIKPAQQVLMPAEQSSNPMLTGVLWALGGAAVTLGGGIFVVGTLALFSQQQRGRRTVQVIHPLNTYPPTLQSSRRRSEFLPPRIVESKRVEEVEYDER